MYFQDRNSSFNRDEDVSSGLLSDNELFELKDALIKTSVDFYEDQKKEYSSSYGNWFAYHF